MMISMSTIHVLARTGKRGEAIQSCTEAAIGCTTGQKNGDDDDEKPLKERSTKYYLQVILLNVKLNMLGLLLLQLPVHFNFRLYYIL